MQVLSLQSITLEEGFNADKDLNLYTCKKKLFSTHSLAQNDLSVVEIKIFSMFYLIFSMYKTPMLFFSIWIYVNINLKCNNKI